MLGFVFTSRLPPLFAGAIGCFCLGTVAQAGTWRAEGTPPTVSPENATWEARFGGAGSPHMGLEYCEPPALALTADMDEVLNAYARERPGAVDISDEPCVVAGLLQQAALESGLPPELAYAVAYTESGWQHWDENGDAISSGTDDHGLMQINSWWDSEYDWDRITGEPAYNIAAGVDILAWSYNYAVSQGYRGEDALQAAYAVYNGGPDAVDRPFDEAGPHAHDEGFWGHYVNEPWTALLTDCP